MTARTTVDDAACRTERRRTGRVPLLLSAAALLTACGGVVPLPAGEAVAHYDEVAAELTSALGESTGQEWSLLEHRREVQEREGVCRYSPGDWETGTTLPGVSGDDGWDEIIAAVDPVLVEHGFSELGRPTRQGALYLVRAADEHGAEVTLSAQGTLRIADAEITTESCSAESLAL
ncbi:MAG: hypothetical protein ACTH6N_07435 [Brachybacterium tyrofermentans]|uniref:hypothetical protein n=1 Tax=Brachybacterium tyrofermentans TaxID=47848 RepID=UPI001865F26E|nr:hypothetical protein [Brachybacterium tyrofermentans]